ncbi:MAG: choice-of-anchor D domain-containing protein [Calditrichota bacterium]
MILSYSNIQGGQDGIDDNHNIDITWGDGNIDADPLFVDPDHGDYHLTENSPCIDAGDPDSRPDPDGTRADMGAFYFHQDVPHPVIFVEPDSLDFGTIGMGDVAFDTLTIHNFGGEPLSVTDLFFAEQEAFTIESGGEPFDLQTGESHIVVIHFSPPDSLAYRDVISIISNDPANETVVIPLAGRAILMVPRLEIEPDILEFGYVPRNDQAERQIILNNSGNRLLNVLSLAIDPWQSPFRVIQGAEVATIDPDSSWALTIRFSPVSNRAYEAVFQIESDDPERPIVEIELLGSALSVGDDRPALPTEVSIAAIYPNPFNSTTEISIGMPQMGDYTIQFYNSVGKLVAQKELQGVSAGYHIIKWFGEGLASGIYICELHSGGKVARGKLVLIR